MRVKVSFTCRLRAFLFASLLLSISICAGLAILPKDFAKVNASSASKTIIAEAPRRTGALQNPSDAFDSDMYNIGQNGGQLTRYGMSQASINTDIDLSSYIAFPAIGDQRNIGSCTAWATTYYAFTYQVNHLLGRSASDENNVFSPKHVYNMINNGEDKGSYITHALEILQTSGAVTEPQFRFSNDELNYNPNTGSYPDSSWPTDVGYQRQALATRVSGWQQINLGSTVYEGNIKSLLDQHRPVIFETDFVSTFAGSERLNWTSRSSNKGAVMTHAVDMEPCPTMPCNNCTHRGGHAMVIIGYDDSYEVDIGDGQIMRGAFKVANSWGTSWNIRDAEGTTYNNTNGYIWIMYDALRSSSQFSGLNIQNRIPAIERAWAMTVASYPLHLTAEVTFTTNNRSNIFLQTAKIGTTAPITNNTLFGNAVRSMGGARAFDGGTAAKEATFVFDMSATSVADVSSCAWQIGISRNNNSSAVSTTGTGIRLIQTTSTPVLATFPGTSITNVTNNISAPVNHLFTQNGTLAAPQNVLIGAKTVSWTAVAGANSYRIFVNGSSQVTNITATAYNLSQLTFVIGSNTIQVQAIGSGNFENSPLSTAIVFTSTAGISINVSTHTFDSDDPLPISVTVTNTGNRLTGALAVTISNTNFQTSITTSGTSDYSAADKDLPTIAVGSNRPLWVKPTPGLATGTYSATITVSGTNITSRTFSVEFTTVQRTLTLNATTHTYTSTRAGYTERPAAYTVIITNNTADLRTSALTITVSSTTPTAFELSTQTLAGIASNSTAQFTIQPVTGLSTGTYNATYSITGGNTATTTFTVTFVVQEAGGLGNNDTTNTTTFLGFSGDDWLTYGLIGGAVFITIVVAMIIFGRKKDKNHEIR